MNRFEVIDFPEPADCRKVWAATSRSVDHVAVALLENGFCPALAHLFHVAASEHSRLTKICENERVIQAAVGDGNSELQIVFAGRSHATDAREQHKRECEAKQKLSEAVDSAEQVRIASVHKRGIEERFWIFIHPDHERKVMPANNQVPEAVRQELNRLHIADNDETPWAFVTQYDVPRKQAKTIQSPLVSASHDDDN